MELVEISSAEATTGMDIYNYGHAWQTPSDLISIYRFNGVETGTTRTPWKVANDILYADCTEAKLEYVRDVTDVTLWPDDFVNAVSWFLAAAIAPSMSSDANLGMKLLQFAEQSLGTALAADSDQEGRMRILNGLQHTGYLNARRGYFGGPSDEYYLSAAAWRDFHPS